MREDNAVPSRMGDRPGGSSKLKTFRALKPFVRAEAISTREAASLAGVSVATIRSWVVLHGLGDRVGGIILASRPALLMYLENNREALRLYHAGERHDPIVAAYFVRCGLDPEKIFSREAI